MTVFSFFGYVFYDKAVLAIVLAAAALIGADLRYHRESISYEMDTVADATSADVVYRVPTKRALQKSKGGAQA